MSIFYSTVWMQGSRSIVLRNPFKQSQHMTTESNPCLVITEDIVLARYYEPFLSYHKDELAKKDVFRMALIRQEFIVGCVLHSSARNVDIQSRLEAYEFYKIQKRFVIHQLFALYNAIMLLFNYISRLNPNSISYASTGASISKYYSQVLQPQFPWILTQCRVITERMHDLLMTDTEKNWFLTRNGENLSVSLQKWVRPNVPYQLQIYSHAVAVFSSRFTQANSSGLVHLANITVENSATDNNKSKRQSVVIDLISNSDQTPPGSATAANVSDAATAVGDSETESEFNNSLFDEFSDVFIT